MRCQKKTFGHDKKKLSTKKKKKKPYNFTFAWGCSQTEITLLSHS